MDPFEPLGNFLTLLMVPKGIESPENSDGNQDKRHDNHHRRGDLPLPSNGLITLQEGGDAVILERYQRFGLRPTEASLAQGYILSSQLLDLSLELGDFVLVIHGAKLRQKRTKLKQIDDWFAARSRAESRAERSR